MFFSFRRLCLFLVMTASVLASSPVHAHAARSLRSRVAAVLAQALAPRHPSLSRRPVAPGQHRGSALRTPAGRDKDALQTASTRETAGPPPRFPHLDVPLPILAFGCDLPDERPAVIPAWAAPLRPTPGLDPEQGGRRGPPLA